MGSGSAQAAPTRVGTPQVAGVFEMFALPEGIPIRDIETLDQLVDCTNALSAQSHGQNLCAIDGAILY